MACGVLALLFPEAKPVKNTRLSSEQAMNERLGSSTLFPRNQSEEPRSPRQGFLLKKTLLPSLRFGLPFIPTLPGGAFWQIW